MSTPINIRNTVKMAETTQKSWSSADWARLRPDGQNVLAMFAFLEPNVAIPTSILFLTFEELTTNDMKSIERPEVRPRVEEWAGTLTKKGVRRAIRTLLRKGWLRRGRVNSKVAKQAVVMSPQAQVAVLGQLSDDEKVKAFNSAVLRVDGRPKYSYCHGLCQCWVLWAAHIEALVRNYQASREKFGNPMMLCELVRQCHT